MIEIVDTFDHRTPSSTSLASAPDSLDEDIEKGLPEDVTKVDDVTKEEPVVNEPEKKKEEDSDDSDDSDEDHLV